MRMELPKDLMLTTADEVRARARETARRIAASRIVPVPPPTVEPEREPAEPEPAPPAPPPEIEAAWFSKEFHARWQSNRTIFEVVAKCAGIPFEAIRSRCRTGEVVIPRQIGCYIAYRLMHTSLPAIARVINKDHTSVIHSIHTVVHLMRHDDYIAAWVENMLREVCRVCGIAYPPELRSIEGYENGSSHRRLRQVELRRARIGNAEKRLSEMGGGPPNEPGNG